MPASPPIRTVAVPPPHDGVERGRDRGELTGAPDEPWTRHPARHRTSSQLPLRSRPTSGPHRTRSNSVRPRSSVGRGDRRVTACDANWQHGSGEDGRRSGDGCRAASCGHRASTASPLAPALSGAADALVAVSLAGSLFFSLSPEASREQVLLYLVINMAPFALLAPLIGPAIDRFRLGHRWIAAILFALRAACAAALAFTLLDLSLYFFALALLVAAKASGRRPPGARARARRRARPARRRQLPPRPAERHRRRRRRWRRRRPSSRSRRPRR